MNFLSGSGLSSVIFRMTPVANCGPRLGGFSSLTLVSTGNKKERPSAWRGAGNTDGRRRRAAALTAAAPGAPVHLVQALLQRAHAALLQQQVLLLQAQPRPPGDRHRQRGVTAAASALAVQRAARRRRRYLERTRSGTTSSPTFSFSLCFFFRFLLARRAESSPFSLPSFSASLWTPEPEGTIVCC